MIAFILSHQLIVGFSVGAFCGHIVGFTRAKHKAQACLTHMIRSGQLKVVRR